MACAFPRVLAPIDMHFAKSLANLELRIRHGNIMQTEACMFKGFVLSLLLMLLLLRNHVLKTQVLLVHSIGALREAPVTLQACACMCWEVGAGSNSEAIASVFLPVITLGF